MKRKIVLTAFALLVLILLTGCGAKENKTDNKKNSNIGEQQKSNQKDNKKEESNYNNSVIIDDEIIDIDDMDNEPTVGETVTVNEVINCNNCVYAYFSNAKTIGSSISEGEYTKDVTTLKTSGGKQRHNFFGLVLSGNTISKAYACILKDNKIYCIQGSTNGAYHTNNMGILNQIFTASQCKTISDGHTYTCTDGSYNGDTKTNGYTSMHYETSCTIYGSNSNTGKLICH
jgi:hypothetical protein